MKLPSLEILSGTNNNPSSVSELEYDITTKILPLVKKYNLAFTAFSQGNITTGVNGRVILSNAFGAALEPAPVTPTKGSEATAYRLLSGVIRKTRGDTTVVSPTLIGGNTDTASYWNLTPNIFRYSHQSDRDVYNGLHTINEAIRAKVFVETIQFFKNLILTADDATDI